MTPENLETFMVDVKQGLHELEDHVSKIASFVIDELEMIKLQSERIVGDLFEESVEGSPLAPSVPMAAPDTGLQIYFCVFLNRYRLQNLFILNSVINLLHNKSIKKLGLENLRKLFTAVKMIIRISLFFNGIFPVI